MRAETLTHPYPLEVATTVAGPLTVAQGEWHAFLQPSGGRLSSPPKNQSNIELTSTGKCNRLSGWTAKRQIKVTSFYTLYSIVAISVDTNLHTLHPALTASLSRSPPSSAPPTSPTSLPNDTLSPPSSPASFAPTSGLAPSSPTQPHPVTLTPNYPCPAALAPAPPVSPTPTTSISFGPGILEDLPSADLLQAPYPPPSISEADDLASTASNTADEILQAASLQAFIACKQRSTLGALSEAVTRPLAILLPQFRRGRGQPRMKLSGTGHIRQHAPRTRFALSAESCGSRYRMGLASSCPPRTLYDCLERS